MWLVQNGSAGACLDRITLAPPLRRALVAWYRGTGTGVDEAAGLALVQQARARGRWLACDCLGSDLPPPLLTPAYLAQPQTYYLRRLLGAKRPEHRTDCPFFKDRAASRRSDSVAARRIEQPSADYFSTLRPSVESLAPQPNVQAIAAPVRRASCPELAHLLRRLIALAGLNRLDCVGRARKSIADEFAAIMATAARIEAAPGIALSSVLWTHGHAFHSRRAFASLRSLAQSWPAGHTPQGFLLLFAREVCGDRIIAAGAAPIRVATRVQSPSARGRRMEGPYLVLVVLGELPEAGGYAPLRAYAQPIYSGRAFVPMDSEKTRQVWAALMSLRTRLARHGIDLAAEVPLFDICTPDGECRPQVIVEAHSAATDPVFRLVLRFDEDAGPEDLADDRSDAALRHCGTVLTLTERDNGLGLSGHRIAVALAQLTKGGCSPAL